MDFTLLTYDSTLAHVAGYYPTCSALEFADYLTKNVEQFSKQSGVDKNDINFIQVATSDWCAGHVIFFARVSPGWIPVPNTCIVDEVFTEKMYPNLARSFFDWTFGRGEFTDIIKYPPRTPHNLFRTQVR